MLYDESHQQRISQILTDYFTFDVAVSIQIITPEWETPAGYIARLKQQRLDEARLAIKTDPAIIRLIEEFDARVVEDSITPIN
jgi:DNA polymerase-3 subunit gamma/tau